MKKLLFLLMTILPSFVFAQKSIDAQEIITKINEGKAVSYENVTITGKLDLTRLKNMELQNKGMEKYVGGDQKQYISTVEVPVTFRNCTFTGDVIGYYSNNEEHELYQADFTENVAFENCTFEDASAFKYSHFEKGFSFAGSTFNQLALFKYTKFGQFANFSGARFKNGSDFKYVKFSEGVSFENAVFERDADFKYTSFSEKSSFRNAQFKGFANMKYTKFDKDTELSGAVFNGGEDFKYAKIGGDSFQKTMHYDKKD
ncbi:pentapeptide repeat-containing protein [Cytophagaceae bacterium YF14B1]|uniref:Pentapeptide repeat-containing protein n=1 Tax=Xanthocytophaga flava TaxID=3048013 RepID=A0AAE3QLF6_9BACT|nr:pentapeptide repeat-containing protein [Xanthocytophaga flavus]MDJ1479578.1 pentapeptide repeat-containing protein [Xanthocytophaga flavus]